MCSVSAADFGRPLTRTVNFKVTTLRSVETQVEGQRYRVDRLVRAGSDEQAILPEHYG